MSEEIKKVDKMRHAELSANTEPIVSQRLEGAVTKGANIAPIMQSRTTESANVQPITQARVQQGNSQNQGPTSPQPSSKPIKK